MHAIPGTLVTLFRSAAVAATFWAAAATAATPIPLRPTPEAAVQRIDDYAAALEAARDARAMLLVSVEPRGADDDVVGRIVERPDVQRRFAASGTPWVFCRLGMDGGGAALAADPGLAEMRGGAGVFVVDHAHPEYAGRIVSILPRAAGKYYRFEPDHVAELAALPAGSLTQRSLVLAVRIHPEGPQSTSGACDPGLCAAAAAHSAHQARIHRQGHHGWESRSQQLGGSVAEVCAESWPDQDLLDSCVDCVASWRQSSGHWNAVRSPQAAYGYDIRRGSNGIWYATGIFRR